MDGYVREMIVHAVVYQGALRVYGGREPLVDYWRRVADHAPRVLRNPALGRDPAHFYDAWVLGGCARLQPLARRYLAEGRRVDAAFVRAAFRAFEALFAHWSEAPGAVPVAAAVEPGWTRPNGQNVRALAATQQRPAYSPAVISYK